MRGRLCVAIALAAMSISAAPKRHSAAPNPNAAIIARAKQAAADATRDPLAAQFRGLSVVTDGDGNRKVCGQINAKNGYGGYIGFKPFAYMLELGDVIFAPDQDDADRNARNRLGSGCGFGSWTR
jgi:hypothetical protein